MYLYSLYGLAKVHSHSEAFELNIVMPRIALWTFPGGMFHNNDQHARIVWQKVVCGLSFHKICIYIDCMV